MTDVDLRQQNTFPSVLVLGGGAVVRECFAPALERLGVAGRTTVVEPRLDSGDTVGGLQVVHAGFREYLSNPQGPLPSHCIVALPNVLHVEAVRLALNAGMDVLCEKPLATRSSDCRELARLAESSGRRLAVNMVRRLFHSVRAVAGALKHGWLGELKSVTVSHGGSYGWPIESLAPFLPENGGVLADMGPHYLDLALMLVGPLTPVEYEDDWRGGVESECRFHLMTQQGVPVEIRLSRVSPMANEIVLEGSAGRLRMGVDDFDRCVFEPAGAERGGDFVALTRAAAGRSTFADFFAEQVDRFLGGGHGVSAEEAGLTAALIEWAYATRRPQTALVTEPRLGSGGVFVTGATGFIGNHLLGRLVEGATGEITAGFRSFRSCAQISRFPIQYRHSDLLNDDDLRSAVRGKRYVFHLAVSRNPETERRLTVDGTKRLVEACIEEGVESVVVLSTMYVFGHVAETVDEASPYKPIGGAYGACKAEMERWCLDRARDSSRTRIVVLIPTCVYGAGGDVYTKGPVSLAREGRFCWIAGGRGMANVVYVENLADAIVRAAVTPAAHGHRFIVNDESLPWHSFLTPLLGVWADRVTSPTDEEFARLSSISEPPARVRDVASAIVRAPEVWDAASRTRAANLIRPFAKKYAPGLAKLRRTGQASGARRVTEPPPPCWLSEVYGPTTALFSSDKARSILGWVPPVSREIATQRCIEWLETQRLYEPMTRRPQ